MQPTVSIGLKAARAASEQLFRSLEKLDIVRNDTQNLGQFISDTAQSAERTAAYNLFKAYPEHSITGVHSGAIEMGEATAKPASGHSWHIDPLSGLNNYAHGLPMFAFCLICKIKGRTEHVIIINPVTSEEFTASRGQSAQLNGRRIRVSALKELQTSLVMQESAAAYQPRHLKIHQALAAKGSQLQTQGSPALALAYTAAGRADACCLQGADSVELEAGALLVQEAGGLLGDVDGGNPKLDSGNLVAANPKLFKLLLQSIRPAL